MKKKWLEFICSLGTFFFMMKDPDIYIGNYLLHIESFEYIYAHDSNNLIEWGWCAVCGMCVCVRWCLTFQLILALGILLWRGAVGFSCVRGVREKMFSFWGLCFACVVCSVFVSIVLFSSLSVHKLGVDWASLHSLKLCTLEGRKTRRQSIIGQWSTYPINGVFKFRKPFNLRLILFVVCCNCCCDWDCTGDLLLCCENSCCGGCCVSNCCICCNCCSLLAAKRK